MAEREFAVSVNLPEIDNIRQCSEGRGRCHGQTPAWPRPTGARITMAATVYIAYIVQHKLLVFGMCMVVS